MTRAYPSRCYYIIKLGPGTHTHTHTHTSGVQNRKYQHRLKHIEISCIIKMAFQIDEGKMNYPIDVETTG